MQALRKIQDVHTENIQISIPQNLQNRRLEILVFPAEDTGVSHTWPPDFFEETSGCFADSPIIREDQGVYEKRECVL